MTTQLGERYLDAVRMATELHADQLRKGTSIPYISHLLGVSAIVLESGGTEDEAIAGLLHDAVEDQGGPATLEAIRTRFGDVVATIVDGCTDDAPTPGAPKQPWKFRKVQYIEHVGAETNPGIILVSAADKIYNAAAIRRDLALVGELVWDRFNASKDDIFWYYRSLVEAFWAAEDAINPEGGETDPRLPMLLNRFELEVQELELAADINAFAAAMEGIDLDDFDDDVDFDLSDLGPEHFN